MSRKDRIYEIIKIAVTCILFVIASLLGKLGTEHFGNTLFAFNVPAIGSFMIGEIILCLVIQQLKKSDHRKDSRRNKSDSIFDTFDDSANTEDGLKVSV